MTAISNAILGAIRVLLGIVLIASVFLIVANSIGRYVFLTPIIWAEEILGYVLVWTVYLGAVLVTWDGGHLRMDLLSRSLGGASGAIVNGLATTGFLAIGGVIIYQSFIAIREFTHESQVAELPMNVIHMAVPISFALIVLFILVRVKRYLAGNPEEPPVIAPDAKGGPPFSG